MPPRKAIAEWRDFKPMKAAISWAEKSIEAIL
jgi:hypothetical protein